MRIMDNLRRIVRALSTSAHGSAGRPKLSGAQLFVLRQIAATPSLSFGELGTRTLAGQSAVSEVVAKLVASGLVARAVSAEDARQAELTLTARGRRAIAGVGTTVQERLANGLTTLPRAQRLALARNLDAWLLASGLAETPAPMLLAELPAAKRRATSVARAARERA
jgi:DNA-binding MarR family transcriptional regulator